MSDNYRQIGPDETSTFKRRLHIERGKIGAIYERDGNREALLTSKPALGSTVETILTVPMYATAVDIDDIGSGHAAKMTVTCSAANSELTGSLTPLGEAKYDTQFAELRKKIEAHPCMGKLTTTGINAGKSFEKWQALIDSDWVAATGIPSFWTSISAWTLANYKTLKAKGVEEFVMYLPVLTRTLEYLGRPSGLGDKSGKRQSPPTLCYDFIADYDWLLGPDECVQRGDKYERKTTWLASNKVEALLYPAGT